MLNKTKKDIPSKINQMSVQYRNLFEDVNPDPNQQKAKPVKRDMKYFIEEKRSKKELYIFCKRQAKKLDNDPDDIGDKEESEEE